MPSQAQDCMASDIGYATATCTGSLRSISPSDTSQSQVFEHPQAQLDGTCTPSLQTIKRYTHSPIRESVSDTFTYQDHSQPTLEEYQTWSLSMHAHDHADSGCSSDGLAQDNPTPHTAADGWPPQLKEHYEEFLQHVNLDSLLSHLLKNDLLTPSEFQELECFKEMQQRKNRHFLLNVLPRKGSNTFNIFMKCLKAEKEYLGHRYLVEKFCNKKRHV